MRTKCILAGIAVGFLATSARAADIAIAEPMEAPASPVAISDGVHDWTGGYVGLVGGGPLAR